MVIAGAKCGDGVHNATNAWTAAVIQVGAELKVDVRHDRLDADWEHGAVNVRIECLGVIKEHNGFCSSTLCRGSRQGAASHSVMDEAMLVVSVETLRT